MTAKISNNEIPDKNTSTMIIISLIPETYPEEGVGTTKKSSKNSNKWHNRYKPDYKHNDNNLADSY